MLTPDPSSPPRFSGTPANGVDLSSASFTPPAGSLLVICVSAATPNNTNITIAVSAIGADAPVAKVQRNGSGTASRQGYAGIWTATADGTPCTINVRRTNNGNTNRISVKIYVVPGTTSLGPTGASASGRSTTNLINVGYTSTSPSSLAFGCATDGNALGAGTTAPSSTDIADAATFSGQIDAISVVKAAQTDAAGTAVTCNFDAAGAGTAEWRWVTLEVNEWTPALPRSTRSGTFESPTINVPAAISHATVRLQIDTADKALGPDITFTVFQLDAGNNRTVLTSGTVNPGPWTDKFGTPQPWGADPEFGMTGIAGLRIVCSCTTSLTIHAAVLANTG